MQTTAISIRRKNRAAKIAEDVLWFGDYPDEKLVCLPVVSRILDQHDATTWAQAKGEIEAVRNGGLTKVRVGTVRALVGSAKPADSPPRKKRPQK